VLARYTDKTIRDRARLERQLRTIRRQGYATSVAERFAGASAVAAPVLGADGTVIAAVNISGPSDRFTGTRQAEYIRQVTKAALALSRAMGGGRAQL
jgi:DNA-binding IclR family transcriptional regulator